MGGCLSLLSAIGGKELAAGLFNRNFRELKEEWKTMECKYLTALAVQEDLKREYFGIGRELREYSAIRAWISQVEVIKFQVEELMEEKHERMMDLCVWGFCSKNIWKSSEFRKDVRRMIKDLDNLMEIYHKFDRSILKKKFDGDRLEEAERGKTLENTAAEFSAVIVAHTSDESTAERGKTLEHTAAEFASVIVAHTSDESTTEMVDINAKNHSSSEITKETLENTAAEFAAVIVAHTSDESTAEMVDINAKNHSSSEITKETENPKVAEVTKSRDEGGPGNTETD